MVDVVRGVLRVRKWPRKRGTPTHPTTLWWNDWFRQANFLAKYADAMSMRRAIEMTAGTPLYPRDVLLSAMRGRLYSWADDTGWKWYSVAAIGDISESLDVLAQTVGSVLVRAVDRWRAAGPPGAAPGSVLTYQGASAPPIWQSAGAGISQGVLPGTPIVPDGTKNFYDLSVEAYAIVDFVLHQIGFAASTSPIFRVSTDGGLTYRSGASDYALSYLTSTVEAAGLNPEFGFSPTSSASGHHGIAHFSNLKAGRCSMYADAAMGAARVVRRGGHCDFDGPITHIRLLSASGANFDAGDVHATGIAAA